MSLLSRSVAVLTGAIVLGALFAVGLLLGGATDSASAQTNFTVTPTQLKINQRISQAAVRRSNTNRTGLAALKASTDTDVAAINGKLAGPLPAATGSLASGQTVRGAYNTGGTAAAASHLANTSISFVFALAQAPTVTIIQAGGPSTPACTGSASFPEAASGNLCIYAEDTLNVSAQGLELNGVTRAGATIFVRALAAGNFYSFGTWAVTAP